MRLCLAFLFFWLFLSFTGKAQKTFFEPGYIVLGIDTVSGFVDHTDEITLSHSVQFKSGALTSPTNRYQPADLTGFGFSGTGLHFRSVEVSLRKQNLRQDVPRFGKLLVSGLSTLYYLHLPSEEQEENQSFVFVLQKEGRFHTLAQYKTLRGSTQTTDNRYRGSLKALLADCPSLTSEIERLPFRAAALVSLIKHYNACRQPELPAQEYNYQVKTVVHHGLELGSGSLRKGEHARLKNTLVISAGYFLELNNPVLSRKISYEIGINYLFGRYTYVVKGYDPVKVRWNDIDVPQEEHFVRVPLLGKYTFNPVFSERVVPFLKGGLTVQMEIPFTDGRFIYTPYMTLGTGIHYGRMRVSLLMDTYGFSAKSNKFYTLALGYRFDQHTTRQ